MKQILAIVMSGLALAGCTTTIKYTPSPPLPTKGKTSLRVAVFDFGDRTEGQHCMDWDWGWTYSELGKVTADVAADVLANSGQFQTVERIRSAFTQENLARVSYDIVVGGEIRDFKAGSYPHPADFINPLALLYLIGLPTVYVYEEGTFEGRSFLISAKNGTVLDEILVQTRFGPNSSWISLFIDGGPARRKRGLLMLKTFETEFGRLLHQRLDGPLGQQIVAMNPPSSPSTGVSPVVPAMTVLSATTITPSSLQMQPVPNSIPERPVHPPQTGNRFALVVGVSKYQHTAAVGPTDLAFADEDARGFAAALKAQGWDEDYVKILVNEHATKREIEKALDGWLTKAGADDLIVLFWAGHGFPDPENPEKVYFACHDTEVNAPATGLRMDRVHESLKERGARNVVVLADTCHAGKLATRGDDRALAVRPYVDRIRREQSVPKGWIYLCGAETDRQSVEHTSWKNGAFTHCLLQAMSGAADGCGGAPQDGIITLGEIKEYLLTAMPDETQKVLGVTKRPFYATSSGDPEIWNLTLRAPKE